MQFDHEATITAPAAVVWDVYSDVERWPEWTRSIKSVRYVGGDRLGLGARARIQQPKLPAAEWEVTALDPGHAWTWVAKAAGVRSTAVHEVVPVDAETTIVRTRIEQRGPLGAIIGLFYGRLTRTYLAMEADGLKARSEARASA